MLDSRRVLVGTPGTSGVVGPNQNTSQIQILRHFEKKRGAMRRERWQSVRLIDWPQCVWPVLCGVALRQAADANPGLPSALRVSGPVRLAAAVAGCLRVPTHGRCHRVGTSVGTKRALPAVPTLLLLAAVSTVAALLATVAVAMTMGASAMARAMAGGAVTARARDRACDRAGAAIATRASAVAPARSMEGINQSRACMAGGGASAVTAVAHG